MGFRVRPAPMPGNNPKVGDKSGPWRVEIYNDATGTSEYEGKDMSYDEAFKRAGELDRTLNQPKEES
jgi:hypothetical protein